VIAFSTAMAARTCAPLHNRCRSTKLNASDRRLCDTMLLPRYAPGRRLRGLGQFSPTGAIALGGVGSLPIAAAVVRRADTVDRRRSGHHLGGGRVEGDRRG